MAVENLITKVCSKCHQELPLDCFNLHAEGKYGRRSNCKECCKRYRAIYYQRNAERLIAYSNRYYKQNKPAVLEYSKAYRDANKEQTAKAFKLWREANREKIKRDKAAAYQSNKATLRPKRRAYNQANKESLSLYFKEYAQVKPEVGRTAKRNYKARKKGAAGSFTREQWLDKCRFYSWRCYLCSNPLTPQTVVAEHRIPLSRGRLNWVSNLAPSCAPCNLSKNNKTEREYRAQLLK